jgi:site-specific recombinase XerD
VGEITLRKALDDYKTVYMAYRNFAERTREEYLNDLEGLLRFLEKSGINHVGEVGIPIIERYVAHLEQKGFASLTRKRKVVAIRSFLAFLYVEDYITSNIAKKIVLPFTESTTPHVLTQTECNQLRLACAGSQRDTAIIELLLQTGITLSELINLTMNDVDLDEGGKNTGFIRILGRRAKKSRVIPLNTKASSALKSYMDERKGAKNSILFLNRFEQPLGERGVQKMLRKYLKRAGVKGASIHTLRHTFGAQHIARGTDLKTVQEVLGLKDSRSASVYQALAKEKISRELQDNSI